MANFIRLAESGNEWTSNELKAYNIEITFQDTEAFFSKTLLPTPSVHPIILTALTDDDATDDASYAFLIQLDMMPTQPEESAINDFSVAPLYFLGYAHRPRTVRTRKEFQLFTCGESKYTEPNVCIIDCDTRTAELNVLDSKVIPGVIMFWTSPSFFKISVTLELTQCVESGTFPSTPTIVTGHVPDIPRLNLRFSGGMKVLDNRQVLLQCYEAFKKFVV